VNLRVRTVKLHLRHTFTISRGSEDVAETVIVELEKDGITGYGEACPTAYYGHSPASVIGSIERARPSLAKSDPLRYRDLLSRLREELGGPDADRAALCALDLAVHDWVGKRWGLPLHRLLGLAPERIPLSDFTIGIDSIPRMVEKAKEAAGFPILKIKLGTPDDLAVVRALREVTGATFRVDANCAWNGRETVEKSRQLKELGVEFIEQPLPPERLGEMAEVRRSSALPLYADESAVEPADVLRLAGAFDGIVIKLVKCGGILPALSMIELARASGLKVMFGCMIESSVSISAAAQIGPLADHLDLDGAILITDDPFEGVHNVQGKMVLPERAGLGVLPLSGD
jgi:L-alanine-DL-glutamate epimerase-like enolase superfamily enzyme